MAAPTYTEILTIRRQIADGETELETAARSYSLDELAQAVRQTRALLQAVADDWTQDQLLARPPLNESEDVASGEDRWSATETISHMLVTQNWYLLHMGRLIGRREHFDTMPRGLGDQARQDVLKGDLATHLRASTSQFLDYVASIPADADLTQTRDSTFFGNLSLRGWVLLASLHDAEHYAQIQRVAALPTFPSA